MERSARDYKDKLFKNNVYANHGKKWDEESISILLQRILLGQTWKEISIIIQRKPDAIKRKYGNLIIERLDNRAIAKSLLSASGSSEPPNDPKLVISGAGGESPSENCQKCGALLGPRCSSCGNTIKSINFSQNDFFMNNGD